MGGIPGMRRRDAIVGVGAAAAGAGAVRAVEEYAGRGPLRFYGGTASLLPYPDPDAKLATSMRLVWRVQTHDKAVALTFDDGPRPDWTPKVLAALDAADVPATFFCTGRNVRAHGALHKDSLGRHELGNHTDSHTDLGRLDLAGARAEIERCSEAMAAAYGRAPTLFRPPYGHASGAALMAAAAAGLTTVLWTAQFHEGALKDRPDAIVGDAARQLVPGAILLGHDTGSSDRILSIARLPALLTTLKADGWSFHTVSDLLARESG